LKVIDTTCDLHLLEAYHRILVKNIWVDSLSFCQSRSMHHHPRMKAVLWIFTSCVFTLLFSSCGNSGRGNAGNQLAGTGPFDKNGRYVEEWADTPSKWRKPGSAPSPHEMKSDELPQIAQNEQPPQNAIPLAPASVTKRIPVISQTAVTTKSKSTATKSQPVTIAKSGPTKIKSKAVVVKTKAKTKPKPKSTRYVVKSGDSLSAIASRTGASVSAIKSANSISGTVIRPGQSLTIPKK
jgi:LysM repeat protein